MSFEILFIWQDFICDFNMWFPINTGKPREISRIKFYHICGCSGTGLCPNIWEVEAEGSEILLSSGYIVGSRLDCVLFNEY